MLAFVLGLANAFDQPTRQAFVVEMVGKDDLMNAVALNSGMFNARAAHRPGDRRLLIAAVGVKVAFLLNGISFIPVIIGLLMMRHVGAARAGAARAAAASTRSRELREGLSYAFRTPSVLLIIILVAIIGTFGYNFTVMLPLLDEYVLDQGEVGLGFMTAAVGLGALISALVLAEPQDGDEAHAVRRRRRVRRPARRWSRQPVVPADAALPAAARHRQHGVRLDREHVAAARDAGPPARPRDGALHAALRRLDADRRLPHRLDGRGLGVPDRRRHRGGRCAWSASPSGLLYYFTHREQRSRHARQSRAA